MARIPWLAIAPLAIFGALAGLFLAGNLRDDPDTLPSTRVGQMAPALTLSPLGDLPALEAEALREPGVKLVNFWASWCAPCRVEHPTLEALAEGGIRIFGVNYKDDSDKALGFLAELGNPYAGIGADENGRMAIDWGVYGVPETYVIDSAGKIVLRFAGPITQRSLEQQILPAIAEAESHP